MENIKMESGLVKLVNESGLDKTKSQVLLENFSNYFEIASDWEKKANMLVVDSIEQKAEMKMAREGRLFLREKRIAIEKTRKALKENALREGQTIDAIAKVLTNLISPIEKDLEEKEKFAEIQEAKRIEILNEERSKEIEPYTDYIPYGIDFGRLSDEDYNKLLSGAKLQKEAEQEAQRKAEEERIAKEKAEAEERERVRLENERLKKEAEDREIQFEKERAKAEAERKKIEDDARKEREEQEKKAKEEKAKADAEIRALEEKAKKEREDNERLLKIEREKQAKIEAERKAEQDRIEKEEREKIEAEKRAKNAPDKEKLILLSKQLNDFELPEVASDESRKIIENVRILLSKTTAYIDKQIENL